jgi:hypothetical protein
MKITPEEQTAIDQADLEGGLAPFHSPERATAPSMTRCGEPGCEAEPVDACEYVDSRGKACRTHW